MVNGIENLGRSCDAKRRAFVASPVKHRLFQSAYIYTVHSVPQGGIKSGSFQFLVTRILQGGASCFHSSASCSYKLFISQRRLFAYHFPLKLLLNGKGTPLAQLWAVCRVGAAIAVAQHFVVLGRRVFQLAEFSELPPEHSLLLLALSLLLLTLCFQDYLVMRT